MEVPLLMLAASAAFRGLSFIPAVIETDEGLYIVQAREWLRGNWPLIGVWDMHPVGAPALFAVMFALLGESITSVRVLGGIAAAWTGMALHAIARASGLPRAPALGAGVLYIAMTTRFGGLATNTEILFAPLVATALALALRAAVAGLDHDAAPRVRTLVPMGLLVGTALTIKPVAVPEGCLAFAVLTFPAWRAGLLPTARGFGFAGAYALLCLSPTAAMALAYAVHGGLGVFLDAVFVAPLRYAGSGMQPGAVAWLILGYLLFLWWPFGAALAALLRAREAPRTVLFGVLWFVAASIGIALPGMYFNHYFLLWLPPLALLGACGVWSLVRRLWPARMVPAFAVCLAILAVDSWADRTAVRVHGGVGLRNADPVLEVADALRANVPNGAPALIANYHPVVYMLADVGLPSRYIFPAQLTGEFGDVAGIDMDAEVARILAARPAAIVIDRGWWDGMRPEVQAMLNRALGESYALAAQVSEERGPVEIWRLRSEVDG